MKIETKYNIDDIVWYIENGKAQRDQIVGIEISVGNQADAEDVWIRYTINGTNYSEHEIHSTKEELIALL